jgi:hypothetical protein
MGLWTNFVNFNRKGEKINYFQRFMKFYEIEEKGIILSNPANTSEHQRATSERTANTSEHQRKESNHSEHQRTPAKKSEQQRRPNYPNLHDESQIAIKMAKFSQTDQNVDM